MPPEPAAPTSAGEEPERSGRLGLAGHALLALPALVLLGPDLLARRLGYLRDAGSYFAPYRLLLGRALHAGALPEWNPLAYEGHPLLADPNYSAFHPLSWLVAWLPDARGLALLSAGGSLLAAHGAARLGALFGLGRAGRIAAGLCFAGCGAYLSLQETGQSLALAAMPWVCAGFAALGRHPGGRALAGAALAVALAVVSGTPEVGACAIGLGLAVALAVEGDRPLAQRLPWLPAALLLGLCAAAAQALPAWSFLRQSDRAGGWTFAQATALSLHPLRLLGLALPFVAGEPDLGEQRLWGALTGQDQPWIEEWTVGLLPLALLLAGLGWRSRGARALLAGALLLLLPALGSTTPPSAALWRHLDLLRTVRFPEKLALPLVLPIALYAGAGVERLRARPGRPRARLLLLALAAAGALGCALLPAQAPFARTALASAALELGLLAAALAALELSERRRPAGRALAALALGLDLLFPALRLHHSADERELLDPPAVLALLRADAGAAGASFRVDSGSAAQARDLEAGEGPRPLRLFRLRRAALWGAAPMLDGVRLARGYSGFTSGPMHALFTGGAGAEVMELLGVRYAVEYGSGPGSVYARLGFEPLAELPGPVRVWKNPRAGPRVRVVAAVLRGGAEGPIPRCADAEAVWLTPADAARLPPGWSPPERCAGLGPPAAAGRAELLEEEPDRLVLRAELPAPALVVLADAADAGWSAALDGVPAPALSADGALRAVAAGPGTHRIEWRYRTPGLRTGAAISLAALALLAWLSRAWRRA